MRGLDREHVSMKQSEVEVWKAMQRIAEAYSSRDAEALLDMVAPNCIGFGSISNQKIIIERLFRRGREADFSRCESLSLRY